ncbi:tRNA (guanosine(37)-N1)-methyltransferase TrmD [Nocardioides donggukensis]|uniref:tRNA (guanine-N(1)-)-methyltransferase n=1 Tax=Nocardioides donggukensis TaxID=2774019 RepID=A0A927PYV2_9ACTN|nr:tRNA (guanosine(37)-N1)-methyltransferase TrmD [Nocardioides donggukensis]MBD8869038.1 tRNA (guanosine(37)-N1)-methyltransferase TrmD [Nocardioides donggukensis]
MRIDVVSIFPDYLAPLELSLPGKARGGGLLDLRVHDLRQWTHDRHHTTDDTPYGGGAGMVMRPEPWGEALDALATDTRPTVVVPTPSGARFIQAMAAELAEREHLVFACGRYEGIDQRVLDHLAETERVAEVREVSLGDYVLNGGEVAALAIIEAVVRLLPGFMGNPESLAEESHADGLLEYPVYTRPASWRGRDVPAVLLSGDHAAIAAWRHEQALQRTAERRPDLAHPSRLASGPSVGGADGALGQLGELELRTARPADLGEIQTLQWACVDPDLREPLDVLGEALLGRTGGATGFVLRAAGRLVGTIRCELLQDGTVWHLSMLMVAPDLRGRGLGRLLLEHAEAAAPPSVTTYRLFVAGGNESGTRLYRRAGYRSRTPGGTGSPPLILTLTKPRRSG